jgi:hypothetical protein
MSSSTRRHGFINSRIDINGQESQNQSAQERSQVTQIQSGETEQETEDRKKGVEESVLIRKNI